MDIFGAITSGSSHWRFGRKHNDAMHDQRSTPSAGKYPRCFSAWHLNSVSVSSFWNSLHSITARLRTPPRQLGVHQFATHGAARGLEHQVQEVAPRRTYLLLFFRNDKSQRLAGCILCTLQRFHFRIRSLFAPLCSVLYLHLRDTCSCRESRTSWLCWTFSNIQPECG